MRPRRIAVWSLTSLVALVAALALAASTGAGLSPSSNSFTLRAGDPTLGVATETKTVDVPAKPPKADIELAIDTTGSMQPSIDAAKAEAANIVSGVKSSVPDSEFAVVQFKDAGDSPEYQVVQSMTGSAADVQTALNSLSAVGGGDAPEAYNLVFHNSFTPAVDGPIGWRTETRKFVIVIGDAQPHGNLATQGFAGCINESADPHGFSTTTELAGMKANERTLMMIRQVSDRTSTTLQCYQSLAAASFPIGSAVDEAEPLHADRRPDQRGLRERQRPAPRGRLGEPGTRERLVDHAAGRARAGAGARARRRSGPSRSRCPEVHQPAPTTSTSGRSQTVPTSGTRRSRSSCPRRS